MKTLLPLFLLACAAPEAESTDPPEIPLDLDVTTWTPDTVPFTDASRVVFMGDSITYGYGIQNPKNTYKSMLLENNDRSWPNWNGDDLTHRYGELDVIDVSRNGAQTPDLLNTQLPQLDEALTEGRSGPTLIFVTIGGNDMTNSLQVGLSALQHAPSLIESNIRTLAEALLDVERFPDGSMLFLTNVYEPTDGTGQADECFLGLDLSNARESLFEANRLTLELAQELDFAWVDLRGQFAGHGYHHDDSSNPFYHDQDPTLWFQDDCIHPNRRGHHELRRLFLAAVDGEPLILNEAP